MSRKTTPDTRIEARIRNSSPYAQDLYRNPFFMRAVNKAADMKCLHAIQTGRLRMAVPTTLPHPYRYIPRMDLVDDPSSSKYLAIFEVPGMKTENMSLQIHNNHLIIKGERKSPYPKPSATDNQLSATTDASSGGATQVKTEELPHITTPVQELRFGAFHRAIPVPKGIKDSDVTASILDGLLTVTWPKAPTAIESPKPAKTPNSPSPPMAMLALGTSSQ